MTKWTEAGLVDALVASRYTSNEWAMLRQVRDDAGWDRRTFDAVAIGLWASRGHPIHGFECKASKADWKRELKQPEKAEPLVAICDMWWVVAPTGVVDPMTLPVGWGLLQVGDKGTVTTVAEAHRREAAPLTRGFVAQVLKSVARADAAAIEAERVEARAEGARHAEEQIGLWRKELEGCRARLRALEAATGLPLSYADIERIKAFGDVIRAVAAADGLVRGPLDNLVYARRSAARFLEETADLEGLEGQT